jgi:HAD superfamily hydrolase (TIGR01509 family)
MYEKLWEKRGFVFDLDGTLIDSMEIWREIDEEFFAKRNLPVPENYQETIAHLGFRECAKFTITAYMPNEKEEDIISEWRVMSLEKYGSADGLKYFKPGAIDFLKLCKQKSKKMCIATASSPDFFMPILKTGGVLEFFDAITTVDEVGVNKSKPEIFKKSAEKLGLETSDCAVFEDNLVAMRAGKKTGMFAVGVYDKTSACSEKQIRKESDIYITDFRDLL